MLNNAAEIRQEYRTILISFVFFRLVVGVLELSLSLTSLHFAMMWCRTMMKVMTAHVTDITFSGIVYQWVSRNVIAQWNAT